MGNGDYADIKFSYVGKDGQNLIKTIRIQKGVVIDFKNKDGYYENTFTINDNGEAVALYGPQRQNQVLQQIEATEEQINEILRIQRNNNDEGLSKKDYEIEHTNRAKKIVAEDLDRATIYTYKKNHPFLGKILPDSWIRFIAE